MVSNRTKDLFFHSSTLNSVKLNFSGGGVKEKYISRPLELLRYVMVVTQSFDARVDSPAK